MSKESQFEFYVPQGAFSASQSALWQTTFEMGGLSEEAYNAVQRESVKNDVGLV